MPPRTDNTAQPVIVFDVWGGELHMEHEARYLVSFQTALQLLARELNQGYLVNMRNEVAWGDFKTFDNRLGDKN